MKATFLMKPEGERKKVEANEGNKEQLYASNYFTPEMAGLAKALLPSVFSTEIQCN